MRGRDGVDNDMRTKLNLMNVQLAPLAFKIAAVEDSGLWCPEMKNLPLSPRVMILMKCPCQIVLRPKNKNYFGTSQQEKMSESYGSFLE